MALHGEGVVGMYLYGEVFLGVDELHKQGQLAAEFLIDTVAEDVGTEFVDDADDVAAFQRTVGNGAGAGGHGRYFPRFGSPHEGMEILFEKKRVGAEHRAYRTSFIFSIIS
jgi:hypothetical protein